MSRNVRAPALVARLIVQVLAAIMLVVMGYAAAGLIGGSVPVNVGWRAPEKGATVWVESSGVHAGLVVPKLAAGVDWRRFAPAGDLGDPRYGGYGYLAIGWGERGFYLDTPRWADLRPGAVLHAALGSEATLLHLEHVPRPKAGPSVRAVVLSPDEYRRLTAFIAASRVAGGRRWRGYGPYDVFYEARGRYDAVHTCNSWTGAALAAAGVRVGWWTPFPVTVLGWFSNVPNVRSKNVFFAARTLAIYRTRRGGSRFPTNDAGPVVRKATEDRREERVVAWQGGRMSKSETARYRPSGV